MSEPMSEPMSELVEVVDALGEVLRVVTRSEARAGNLRHRCTYIAVVTSDVRLVVHRRADWKDVYPGYWDVCFGGVCAVGEGWETSARRELAEEAGITDRALIELGPVAYDGDDGHIVGCAYLARFDGPVTCTDGEVVAVDYIPLAELDRWMADRAVCPDSEQLVLPLVLRFLTAD